VIDSPVPAPFRGEFQDMKPSDPHERPRHEPGRPDGPDERPSRAWAGARAKGAPPPLIEDFESRRIRAECARTLFGDPAPDPLDIDRFRLTGTLGHGGQGVVFRAFDPNLGREVALKLLADGSKRKEDQVLREARTLARISHDNVIKIFESGLDEDGRPFIVMELVEGTDLGTWLATAPHRWHEVVETFVAAGRGLNAAHERGIVHRDFKPRNVLVGHDGSVKVVDFGIAASPDRVRPPEDTVASPVVGTLPYMAPEQLAGQAPDALGDQYSFCVALFEALYSYHPHRNESGFKADGATTSPSPGRGPYPGAHGRVPKYFKGVVTRGLKRDPKARYAGMKELLDALARGPWWRRTFPRAVMLVAFGASATAVLIGRPPSVPTSCIEYQSAASEWSELREQLAQSIEADESSTISRSFGVVDTMLQRHAQRLDDAHAETCSALAQGPTEATSAYRQLGCLDYSRDSIARITREVSSLEPQQLVSIPDRLGVLQSINDCRLPLQAMERCDPWVDSPGHEDVSSTIETTLADARAAAIGGDYERGLGLVQDAIALASEPALRPQLAQAYVEQGRLAFEGEQLGLAVSALMQARALAEREGCDRLNAEALTLLSKALVLQRGDSAALADSWSMLALDKLERVGAQGRLLASGLGARGLVLNLGAGAAAAADGFHLQAIGIQEGLLPDAQLELSDSLLNRGSTLARLSRLDDAIEVLERGIALRTELLGDQHPTLQKLYYQLGLRRMEQGQLDEADRLLTLALSLVETGLGQPSRRQGEIHLALAKLHERRQDLRGALGFAHKAKGAFDQALAPDHLLTSDALETIGQLLIASGEPEQGLTHLERAQELMGASPQAKPEDRAILGFKLGSAYAHAGRWNDALERYQDARRILQGASLPPGDDALAYANFYLGEALLQLDRVGEAVAPLEAAIAAWTPVSDKGEMLAFSRWLLGKARCWSGQAAQGRALVTAALDYFEQAPPLDPGQLDEMTTWMASHCAP
jgi:eukaryotic-like serine/threonine-protein kinase